MENKKSKLSEIKWWHWLVLGSIFLPLQILGIMDAIKHIIRKDVSQVERNWIFIVLTVYSCVILAVIFFLIINGSVTTKDDLAIQMRDCKTEVSLLEKTIAKDETNSKNMGAKLDHYKNVQDIENYNNLIDPYNSLVKKINEEIPIYENKLANCNSLIDQYNK